MGDRPTLLPWEPIGQTAAWALLYMDGERCAGWGCYASFTNCENSQRFGSPRIETVWSRAMVFGGHDVEMRLWAAREGTQDYHEGPDAPVVWEPDVWQFALAWPGLDVGEVPDEE